MIKLKLLKSADQPLTEELLQKSIGKIIYAPVNKHLVVYEGDLETEEVNAWFAGRLAGYQKTYAAYDHLKESYFETPIEEFTAVCTDEMAFVLGECELYEITPEEFNELAAKCVDNEDYEPTWFDA